MDKIFLKPEKPFLLLTRDQEGSELHYWLKSVHELEKVIFEREECGEKIIDAIEIGSYRDIEIHPGYSVEDFIKEINSTYNNAKERGFDNIVLVIETDVEQEYFIYDIEEGFQCDEFICYYDDLDSIAAALFDEMIGKVVEIRIE